MLVGPSNPKCTSENDTPCQASLTLFETKMVKTYTVPDPYPLVYPYGLYKGVPPHTGLDGPSPHSHCLA